jgi:hypothetical protein
LNWSGESKNKMLEPSTTMRATICSLTSATLLSSNSKRRSTKMKAALSRWHGALPSLGLTGRRRLTDHKTF